jgi:hypothetical protein
MSPFHGQAWSDSTPSSLLSHHRSAQLLNLESSFTPLEVWCKYSLNLYAFVCKCISYSLLLLDILYSLNFLQVMSHSDLTRRSSFTLQCTDLKLTFFPSNFSCLSLLTGSFIIFHTTRDRFHLLYPQVMGHVSHRKYYSIYNSTQLNTPILQF